MLLSWWLWVGLYFYLGDIYILSGVLSFDLGDINFHMSWIYVLKYVIDTLLVGYTRIQISSSQVLPLSCVYAI